jgi:hypothetical protein
VSCCESESESASYFLGIPRALGTELQRLGREEFIMVLIVKTTYGAYELTLLGGLDRAKRPMVSVALAGEMSITISAESAMQLSKALTDVAQQAISEKVLSDGKRP